MKRKLAELKKALGSLVDQRESLLLVVSCTDVELIYTLKTLEALDDESASDLYLIFAEPFLDAVQYVSAVLTNLVAQKSAAEATLAERDAPPWPPLPDVCADTAAPPIRRLRAAIDHVSSLVPAMGGHRIVWGFLPHTIADQEGYIGLLGQLVPWQGIEPWMRRLRILARDDRAAPFMMPALRARKAPRVLLYEPDMSPEALNDSLVQEASDKSLSIPERMQAFVQLAGLDHAHKRYPQAIEKYKIIYNYYAEQGAPVMQAMALQGIGDVLRRQGNLEGAKEKYHQGLALTFDTRALPVMLNLTSAIGDVSLELKRYAEAEGFLNLAQQLAGKLMNPFAKADALEKQGIAREKDGNQAGAVLVWRDADTLCKTFEYHDRRRTVLERLISAYRIAALDPERRECESELKSVVQAIKSAREHVHDGE